MGIDYGRGQVNIDEQGIRYGIISNNKLQSWIYDLDWQRQEFIACPYCGGDLTDEDEGYCPECEEYFVDGAQYYEDSVVYLNASGIRAIQHEDGDIWFFESPHKAMAGFCSPCAPGAVYLTDECEDAVGYAPPPDWLLEGIKLNYVTN